MRIFAKLSPALLIAPLLLVVSPPAAADSEVCVDLPISSDQQMIECVVVPLAVANAPSASARLYYTRGPLTCSYSWTASVSAGPGVWTYAIGQTSPIPDESGGVNHQGSFSASRSGPSLLSPGLLVRGTSATVQAKISGSGVTAVSVATLVC